MGFNMDRELIIDGTSKVDILDAFLNFFFHINGTYPLMVKFEHFKLTGEVIFTSPYSDAGNIALNITPVPGAIDVFDSDNSSAPSKVKDGLRDVLTQQLSQPLRKSFKQRYDYFALTGLGLSPVTSQTPSRLHYAYQSRPELASPMMHVVGRAANGKLYHMRKTEGGQSVIGTVNPFPSLDTRIDNDPVLVASATDQLELAA